MIVKITIIFSLEEEKTIISDDKFSLALDRVLESINIFKNPFVCPPTAIVYVKGIQSKVLTDYANLKLKIFLNNLQIAAEKKQLDKLKKPVRGTTPYAGAI